MPSFGFWELTLVMFIALLVVGPQRLPGLASQAGAWVGRIRRMAAGFREDLSRELDAQELQKTIAAPKEELEKLGSNLKQTGSELQRNIRHLDPLVKTMDEEIAAGRFSDDPPDGGKHARDEDA